jgi:hypothetical protein
MEYWEKSIRLFHAKFGGKMFSDELVEQRASKPHLQYKKNLLAQTIKRLLGQDPWDTPLYEYGLQLFNERIATVIPDLV